jgi:Na+/H+-dicarboxylate symporter
MKLWKQVLIGLTLGIVTGILLGDKAANFKVLGTIFISLIKMVIVPLIFFALLSGITSVAEGHNFTKVGLKGFVGYLLTATFAVIIGLVAGSIFNPGEGVDLSAISGSPIPTTIKSAPPLISDFLLNLIPTNPLNAMVTDNFLQLVVFTIFTGVTINLVGDKAKPVKEFVNSAAQITFKMIESIVKLAPLGVFGFISWIVGTQGLESLESLGKLVAAVLTACAFQYLLFGVMIFIFGRLSPMPFYKNAANSIIGLCHQQ